MGSSSDSSGIILVLRWGQYSDQGLAVVGAFSCRLFASDWICRVTGDETRDRVLQSMLDDDEAREMPTRSEAADHWARVVIGAEELEVTPADGDIDVQWYSAGVPSRMLRSDLIELIPREDDGANLCGLSIKFTRDGGSK